ncbi:hypothetical protein SteCoe_21660 [Stentor coeruleus]|uniref:Uncharacterized protein n=1 Tax=Stentor coeruleus TaxID=5963 RepID=A0A1R2BP09_9CILI|nr:hypothetical protein SteCoe_21660 [Stentor coeruleus]
MKAVLIIFLSFAYAKAIYDTQVGSSCKSTGEFFITSFNVNPWPPTQGGNSSAVITGIIRQTLSISQIQLVICDKDQNCDWYWQMIFKSYNVGQVVTFNTVFFWPNTPGAYEAFFNVNADDKLLTVEGCWMFSFSY